MRRRRRNCDNHEFTLKNEANCEACGHFVMVVNFMPEDVAWARAGHCQREVALRHRLRGS